MAKIAHTKTETSTNTETKDHDRATTTRIARAGEQSRDAARTGADRAHAMVSAAAEDNRQALQRSAGETVGLGRTALDLIGEQTRHNLHAAAAMGRAVDWAEVAKAQNEFIGASFERMTRFAEHYQATMRAGMSAMSFPGRR